MRVIGLDRRKFIGRPKDLEHHSVDLRRNRVEDIFRERPVNAVVHLGVMHNPRGNREEHHTWNVGGLSRLLEYASRHRVRKFVLLSSANVYGPRPENAQFLNEDAPLLAAGAFSDMRDLVELDMLAHRPVDQLSTGERARVLRARALAARPRLLLLDEPLSNLDPYWVLCLVEILRAAARDGAAVLVALHDLGQLDEFDRALLIADGKIQMDETPADLMASERFEEIFRIHSAEGEWQIRR